MRLKPFSVFMYNRCHISLCTRIRHQNNDSSSSSSSKQQQKQPPPPPQQQQQQQQQQLSPLRRRRRSRAQALLRCRFALPPAPAAPDAPHTACSTLRARIKQKELTEQQQILRKIKGNGQV